MADEKPRRGCSQRMGCVVPALALALLCGGFGFLLGTAVGTDIPAQVAQIAVSDLVDMDMPSLTVQPSATARRAGTPTPSSPSAVPTSAGSSSKCQHNLAFIRDVTIPDDTPMEPGAAFQKTWAVRNAGNCAWAQPLVLKFTAGEKMNAPDSVAVPPAKPGEACEVSVPMKAPAGAGTHYSEWRLCAGGECYGPSIYMQIVTKGAAPATPATRPVPAMPSSSVAPVTQPPSAPTALFLDIVSVTSPVGHNAHPTLKARTAPGAVCSIVVYYKSGPSKAQGLEPQNADGDGNVSWTWQVGPNTTPGTWRIVVTSTKDGQSAVRETTFVVT